uniref:HDC08564 n=1 Tax=Drosophila melanogaster TaxID=7227 RepID=Q6ILR7_DROME|nr:TPA_inf: HDC08564 [Drosophila melanogaster]
MDPPMPHTSATRFNFSDIHERLQRLSLLRYHFNLHGMTTDLQEDALELANGSFGAMAVAANNQHQNHQQQQRHQPCNHNQFAQAHDHQHHGSISTGNHTNSYRYHGQDLVASIRGHYPLEISPEFFVEKCSWLLTNKRHCAALIVILAG